MLRNAWRMDLLMSSYDSFFETINKLINTSTYAYGHCQPRKASYFEKLIRTSHT